MIDENEFEQTPDPNRELQLVKEMIQRTKQTVVNRGAFFLLWGGLVFVACLVTFALTQLDYEPWVWVPWAILIPIGVITSIFLQRKYSRQSKYTSFVEHSYDSVWLACGIAFGIMTFVNGITSTFPQNAFYPAISLLCGIGVFASGRIMEWTSLKVGGLFWWGGATAMMLIPFEYHPLIMAIVIIPGHMIPGFLLKRQFSRQNKNARV
jgi:hypothetical protein